MIVDLLNQFEPEPDGLLCEISKHVSDDMLEVIAAADYGMDIEKHMAALRSIRDEGMFPSKMYWYPAEVLELIRWSEPENPEWKPGRTGEFGHWMRAFSCAALLRATREPYNYGDGLATDSTLVQLILSLHALPVDLTRHAVRFLAWLLIHSDPDGQEQQVCAYAVGVFWFALQLDVPVADEVLFSLAKWAMRRAEELYGRYTPGAISGLHEMVIDCQSEHSWKRLGMELFCLDLHEKSPALQAWAKTIAEELVG